MAERTIYYDLKAFLVQSYVTEFFYVISHKCYTLSEQDPAEQAGLNLTWSKIPEDTFLHDVAHIVNMTNLD